MNLESKLDEIEQSFVDLEKKMSDLAIASNPKEMQKLAKRHSRIEATVAKYREYKKIKNDIDEAKSLFHSGDEEMQELAREEVKEKEPLLEEIRKELHVLLLPVDPNDEKSVIMEIRGGAGGEEAALFGADLYRMYSRFCEREGWKIEVIQSNETGIGGLKEIVFKIDGNGAFSKLKFESGVHRVQRVPVTEAGGRIHTSTATVAVLPEVEAVDVEIRSEDLKIDTYRSSGAGGQHVNMTDSAVRITHLPTGIVVTCQDERSQIKNRAKAMMYLRAKLYDLESGKKAEELAEERRGQIGSGDRSERIRTYNYPQNRITDHRIGVTLYKLDQYLDGDLYEMIDAITMADQTERLQKLERV
ncbi:MAG: peptide chain release factor 1 [Aminobacterium sp.]|jgi:peptide chain release factor 1|uniref:peptide chain release factor 1 n=1 Tax=unclassified Aminobacterium TaxID=2685012 RepID=UPI001BCE4B14|nr:MULTISPECIES: peptide chain release factor 1 [unclassified Aminobacterium]MDD2206538.1 peptide chain release factor 1 [Aminobacterium sp.]MDD3426380.1 peptide chain release factor 1 [Aminobacterium sp.]MDD3707029.1 peptide chain release factor 1 [Aminobacterium sp.]MDD4228456.1 peptide chain release factor 1 [Aminobacterium sp.]MDD4551379.1 peptide chain release factor 1 [Aminobacterium sp.]